LLRDGDRILIGPFEIIFHQANATRLDDDQLSTLNQTMFYTKNQEPLEN